MVRFELSFQNKRVKMWFLIVGIPLILSLVLILLLPPEFYYIPNLLFILSVVVYFGGVWRDRKKEGKR